MLGALVESMTVSKGRNVDVVLRVPTVNSSGPGQVLPGRSGPPCGDARQAQVTRRRAIGGGLPRSVGTPGFGARMDPSSYWVTHGGGGDTPGETVADSS